MTEAPTTSNPADEAPEGMLARMRRLALNSGIYLAGNVLSQGLTLLLLPLYTRYLTPSDYGILGVASSVSVFLTLAFGLALYGAVTRLYFEAESEEERRRLYGTILVFMVAVPALLAVAVHVAGIAGALDFFQDVPYTPYLQYAVGTAYLGTFMQLPIAVYQARQEPRKVFVLTAINALLTAGGTVLLVVFLHQGALGSLRALFVAAAVMAAIAITLTARMSSFRLSKRWLFASLAFALPLVPHLLGSWILFLSDRLVLTQFVSTNAIGIYTVAASVGGAAYFLALAMGRAFSPAITISLKRAEEQSRVPLMGTYWILGMSLGCTAIAMFGADVILLLVPGEFHDAAGILAWIVFGYLALGLYTVLMQGTWFSLKTRMVPVLTLAAGGVNVALNLLLVPHYGITGSAIATLIAFAFLAVVQGSWSNRLHPIAWEYGRWAKILAASLAAFAFARVIPAEDAVARIALEVTGLAVVFPTVLTALRFWRPEEIAFLRRQLRRARGRALATARSALWASSGSPDA